MIRSSLYKMFTLSVISCILACNPDYHLFTPDRANLDVDELDAPTEGSIESGSSEDETETFEDNHVKSHPVFLF